MMPRAGLAADPLDIMLAEETAADHAKARARGERIERIADAAVNFMIAEGRLPSHLADDMRVAVFRAVADDFYGNAAIDVPNLRKGAA